MLKRLTAGYAALGFLALVGAAAAQESCTDPRTRIVDPAETEAWRNHDARRDTALMAEIAGTWAGETRNVHGTANRAVVSYASDGTLTFTFNECGRIGSACVEMRGRGTWAAYRQGGSIAMARRLSSSQFNDLCEHVIGQLTDPHTFVGNDGNVGRRVQ